MSINSKISSGRFLMTITAALCFFWLTKTFCDILVVKAKEIEIADMLPYISSMLIILSNIFTFYFTKKAANGHNSIDNGN